MVVALSAGLCTAVDWNRAASPGRDSAEPGRRLTIYNQGFALVSETRRLALEEGINEVRVTDVTALLQPDSVVLRAPGDRGGYRVLDQAYLAKPLSQDDLLEQHEGKTLRFQRVNPATGAVEVRTGRLIRSGGAGSPDQPEGYAPIVEMDGAIRFSLPGEPIFDRLPDGAAIKPALLWHLWADRAGSRDFELSYSTGGMGWHATYNVVAPDEGQTIDLIGWVSLENRSGTRFGEAAVRLMAGDVKTVEVPVSRLRRESMAMEAKAVPLGDLVTERAFDEYHLYTLQRPVSLADGQETQVEFCRAGGIPASRFYVYDGGRAAPNSGAQAATGPVRATLEFANKKEAGLGLPLPAGTMKTYRAEAEGQRSFVGESRIGHTPAGETIRIELGSVFDLVGERRQTDFREDQGRETAEEAFEVKLRNRRKEAVEIRVVEHLDRWATWRILASSDPYEKKDARTIEFRVKVPPGGEKVVTYQVRYSW
jgi:hypothetical protein